MGNGQANGGLGCIMVLRQRGGVLVDILDAP